MSTLRNPGAWVIRERELGERANANFGKAAARLRQHISSLGKTVGSPWTQDEKTAALAGLIVTETNGAVLGGHSRSSLHRLLRGSQDDQDYANDDQHSPPLGDNLSAERALSGTSNVIVGISFAPPSGYRGAR